MISAAGSTLTARRAADEWVRSMDAGAGISRRLLLYIPRPRARDDERTRDPFEVYAHLGCPFGDIEAEQLELLACQAIPARGAEIRRLFRAGEPSLATLDELDSGRRYPLLRQALATDGPVEVAARVLRDPSTTSQLAAVPGSASEMWRVFQEVYGFPVGAHASARPAEIWRFATYVLFSEFASDLRATLPESLVGLPRATSATHLDAIRALCDNLRTSDLSREAYVDLATSIEGDLGLPGSADLMGDWGDRDTFPIEDFAALRKTIALIEVGDTDAARRIVEVRRRSVWRSIAERGLMWKIAERALEFADAATAIEQTTIAASATPRQHTAAYAGEDGSWTAGNASWSRYLRRRPHPRSSFRSPHPSDCDIASWPVAFRIGSSMLCAEVDGHPKVSLTKRRSSSGRLIACSRTIGALRSSSWTPCDTRWVGTSRMACRTWERCDRTGRDRCADHDSRGHGGTHAWRPRSMGAEAEERQPRARDR